MENNDSILCCLSNWLDMIKDISDITIIKKPISDVSYSCK